MHVILNSAIEEKINLLEKKVFAGQVHPGKSPDTADNPPICHTDRATPNQEYSSSQKNISPADIGFVNQVLLSFVQHRHS